MDKPLRLIPADNGELSIISEGRRYFAARFDGYVKVFPAGAGVILYRLQARRKEREWKDLLEGMDREAERKKLEVAPVQLLVTVGHRRRKGILKVSVSRRG